MLLAHRTAHALKTGLLLLAGTPYYAGMGLIYSEGVFVFGAISDGCVLAPSEYRRLGCHSEERLEFASTELFVEWLSEALIDYAHPNRRPWLNFEKLETAVANHEKECGWVA